MKLVALEIALLCFQIFGDCDFGLSSDPEADAFYDMEEWIRNFSQGAWA